MEFVYSFPRLQKPSVLYLTPSQNNPVHHLACNLLNIHFNIINLSACGSSHLSLSFIFPNENQGYLPETKSGVSSSHIFTEDFLLLSSIKIVSHQSLIQKIQFSNFFVTAICSYSVSRDAVYQQKT